MTQYNNARKVLAQMCKNHPTESTAYIQGYCAGFAYTKGIGIERDFSEEECAEMSASFDKMIQETDAQLKEVVQPVLDKLSNAIAGLEGAVPDSENMLWKIAGLEGAGAGFPETMLWKTLDRTLATVENPDIAAVFKVQEYVRTALAARGVSGPNFDVAIADEIVAEFQHG